MVKRLIFIYYSIPAMASYLDTTLFDAQVDGTKVSPSSMFEGRDVLGIRCAGGSSNSMFCMARQHGADVCGTRSLNSRRYWGYHLLQVRFCCAVYRIWNLPLLLTSYESLFSPFTYTPRSYPAGAFVSLGYNCFMRLAVNPIECTRRMLYAPVFHVESHLV